MLGADQMTPLFHQSAESTLHHQEIISRANRWPKGQAIRLRLIYYHRAVAISPVAAEIFPTLHPLLADDGQPEVIPGQKSGSGK